MADGSIKFDTELNSDGLVSGLGELADKSESAMGSLSQEVNSELGGALAQIARTASAESNAIASDAIAAQRIYEEEREKLQGKKTELEAGYLAELKKNADNIKALRDEEISLLKTSYDVGLISTQEYFSRLMGLRDRYFEYGSSGWQKYTKELLMHNQKLAEQQEKALSDAANSVSDNIKKQYDELLKQKQDLEEKLSDYGGIGKKRFIMNDDEKLEFFTIADMDAQIEKLEEYNRLVGRVKQRVEDFWRTDTDDDMINEKNIGLRREYFEQLRDMSIDDATDFARALLGAPDEKFNDYFSGYEQKQSLAKEISDNLFAADVQDAADSAGRRLGGQFTDALAEELESLSGKFFSTGEEACKSFGSGFMASLEQVLSELSAQIMSGAAAVFEGGQNVENNTSYNIYGAATPAETIRLLREKEEMKQLMLEG